MGEASCGKYNCLCWLKERRDDRKGADGQKEGHQELKISIELIEWEGRPVTNWNW